MKIPKQFEIRGKTWRIEYKWRLTYNKAQVLGLCDFDTRTIYIDRGIDKETKFSTFLHEWLHAVLHEYECGMDNKQSPITRDQEEDIIHAIETELVGAFKLRFARQIPS